MQDQSTAEGPKIRTVRQLLDSRLQIPPYQRPYKWTVDHVAQLIEDIETFRDFGRYRIGTVILHQDQHGGLNVVDGQQRLLTFHLISRLVSELSSIPHPTHELELPESGIAISEKNLIANRDYLREALAHRDDLDEWAEFFFDSCEVVILTVDRLDEAFQMFDSQNTRGRALYPTDLLKAFHIREMSPEHTTEQARRLMVSLWEDIPPAAVNELFSDYLFKIKRWANGRDVPPGGFGLEHVGMFKGIRETDPHNGQNRWAMPYLYAKNYTDDFRQENATLIRYRAMPEVAYPFQIDQPVINGESFFLMVRHYYDLGRQLGLFRDNRAPVRRDASNSDKPLPQLRAVLEVLDPHRHRDTHRLVRNLFDCLLLYYVDRFGEQDLERAATLFARHAMALRVQQKQVRRVTVNQYALGVTSIRFSGESLPNVFHELREALRSQAVLRLSAPKPERNGYAELEPLFDTLSDGGAA